MRSWNADRANALARRALLAGALLYVLTYVAVALIRMRYPFELEWLEGVMLAHVNRVRAGAPL